MKNIIIELKTEIAKAQRLYNLYPTSCRKARKLNRLKDELIDLENNSSKNFE